MGDTNNTNNAYNGNVESAITLKNGEYMNITNM